MEASSAPLAAGAFTEGHLDLCIQPYDRHATPYELRRADEQASIRARNYGQCEITHTCRASQCGEELRTLLADVFTLYLKTKNYHWHMTGPHFRDHHLLLDEQADQLFAMTDAAERARKLGEPTIHSVGEVARLQRLSDSDSKTVAPTEMLRTLRDDNDQLSSSMRDVHVVCEQGEDLATASLLENWIDETERRCWFLSATLE